MFNFVRELLNKNKNKNFDDVECLKRELVMFEKKMKTDLKRKAVQDLHFKLMSEWKRYKERAKKNKSYYNVLISTLQKDCVIYDEFIDDYYKELALAYERTGEYKKAIYISKLAIKKDVKEHTSFENRIKRLQNKLNKT